MYTLIIKPHAIKTLTEAYNWYEEQQTGLGDRFINEVDKCYDFLEKSANVFRKIRKNYRQIICHTFPYVIVYEIIGTEVIVYAVFHTSLSPKWKFKF